MGPHTDILDQHESLRNPFMGSLAFHAGIAGLFFLSTVAFNTKRENWGLPTPGGGAVAISPVKTIPLPSRQGRPNPVANDTESKATPAPPKPVERQKVREPDPNAIPLKGTKQQKPTPASSTQRYRPPDVPRPNQVYTSQGQATVSQMFAQHGAGAVGVDQNSVLGTRFGAYAALLMQRVADHWQTAGLPSGRLPYAIISVDLYRDGSIRNPKLVQTSGNYQIDNSAMRAVTEAAPFPPLPAGYEHNVVNVEFNFQVQR